jgi:hypothetical protein
MPIAKPPLAGRSGSAVRRHADCEAAACWSLRVGGPSACRLRSRGRLVAPGPDSDGMPIAKPPLAGRSGSAVRRHADCEVAAAWPLRCWTPMACRLRSRGLLVAPGPDSDGMPIAKSRRLGRSGSAVRRHADCEAAAAWSLRVGLY